MPGSTAAFNQQPREAYEFTRRDRSSRWLASLKRFRTTDYALRRNPLWYGPAEQAFADLEHAPLEQRQAWVEQRTRDILAHAAGTPYGRSISAGLRLSEWPLLTRDRVQGEPGAFLRKRRAWFASRASTGGTTGAPLEVWRSLRAVAAEQASIDRVLRVSGIRSPALARIAILRADTIKDINDHSPPYWTYTHRGERLVFSSHHLNAATLPHYIGQLKAFAPEVLWVYPTALETLCLLLEDSGQRVPVARVLSSSEVLTSEARALAEQFLGCDLMDYYGQAERVAFAYSTCAGEYRFLPGYSHVEFQPAGGKSDATYHEIVGTPLWNEAMPLVRYRTGDLIKVPSTWGPAELLEVAYGVRTFSEVLGRTADALVRPDGGRIVGMNHVPRGVDHIQRLQIIQEQLDVIRVLVLTRPGFVPDDSERLLHNLRARIPREMDIRIELTDKLERTARGKTPMMIVREQVRAAGPAARTPMDAS